MPKQNLGPPSPRQLIMYISVNLSNLICPHSTGSIIKHVKLATKANQFISRNTNSIIHLILVCSLPTPLRARRIIAALFHPISYPKSYSDDDLLSTINLYLRQILTDLGESPNTLNINLVKGREISGQAST